MGNTGYFHTKGTNGSRITRNEILSLPIVPHARVASRHESSTRALAGPHGQCAKHEAASSILNASITAPASCSLGFACRCSILHPWFQPRWQEHDERRALQMGLRLHLVKARPFCPAELAYSPANYGYRGSRFTTFEDSGSGSWRSILPYLHRYGPTSQVRRVCHLLV